MPKSACVLHEKFTEVKLIADTDRLNNVLKEAQHCVIENGNVCDVTSGTAGTSGVEDQEGVPDLINDDVDNNPSVRQGIAGLTESICHVG